MFTPSAGIISSNYIGYTVEVVKTLKGIEIFFLYLTPLPFR